MQYGNYRRFVRGGRGAKFNDRDVKGYEYGEKYYSFGQVDEIKFILPKSDKIKDTPMESLVAYRKYAVFTKKGDLKSIVFMDRYGFRYKQIDFSHEHDGAKPHVHLGYEHFEKGNRKNLSRSERAIYNKVIGFMNSLTTKEKKEIFQ